jgi:hypothetical protein
MNSTRNGGSDQSRTAFLKQGDSSLGLDDEGGEIGVSVSRKSSISSTINVTCVNLALL